MKVLVLNDGNGANLGDQAINYSLKCYLDILDIDNDSIGLTILDEKSYNKSIKKNKTIIVELLKNILNKYFILFFRFRWIFKNYLQIKNFTKTSDHDVIVIGGGQLLLGNSTFPYAIILWVYFLKKSKKKIVLFSVGVGEKFSFIEKKIFKLALNKIDTIYTRDFTSQKRLKKTFKKENLFISDIAFGISKFSKKDKNIVNLKKKIVLFIPAYLVYKKYNKDIGVKEYLQKWKKFIQQHISTECLIEITYSELNEDKEISYHFLSLLKKDLMNVKLIDVTNLDEMLECIKDGDVIISGRMHPLIIGLSYKKKVITFPISEKLCSFDNQFVQSSINIDEIFQNTLQVLKNEIKK